MNRNKAGFLAVCLVVAVVASLSLVSGCSKTGGKFSFVDSAMVKTVEQMQRRGAACRDNSDFLEAIEIHDSCISMSTAMGDTIQLVVALNNQGTNFRRIGSMKDAADYHFRALALCDSYSDKYSYDARKNRNRSLNGLGNVFLTIGNEKVAEDAFREALKGEKELGSATGQAINLANIGSIKQLDGDLDSARVYYKRSMEENRKDNNTVGISLCYSHLGELDELSGNINGANINFRKSYSLGLSTNDTWHWLTPCISLAQNFLSINKLDSAEKYISSGINAAHDIRSNEHLATLYGLRSMLEEKRGQTVPALHDLRKSRTYTDSLLGDESRNAIENSRINYEVNRLNNDVRIAENKAASRGMMLQLLVVFLVIIVVLAAAWWIVMNRTMTMRRKVTAERELFYRNVTHQLRTPMVVVLGMIHQLGSHISADDKTGQEELSAAKRQSTHLLNLIKQLIVASKSGEYVKLGDIGDVRTMKSVPDEELQKNKFDEPLAVTTSVNTSHRQWSILVVEDNEDVALLVCGMLRENGYSVTHAIDGQEALELLADGLPDLLITDISMPRMDGLELMRTIRADASMRHLPIIVVSARVEDSDRLEGIEAGADVYLEKPFLNDELLLRVKKTLEHRAYVRQSSGTDDNSEPYVMSAEPEDEECEFLLTVNRLVYENMRTGEVNSAFIAKCMCISVSTLNRKIKTYTGLPSAVYIRNRRLIEAKRLLLETDMPIGEIEAYCGFNTLGHLSRLFRVEVGCSPSEYRNRKKTVTL